MLGLLIKSGTNFIKSFISAFPIVLFDGVNEAVIFVLGEAAVFCGGADLILLFDAIHEIG